MESRIIKVGYKDWGMGNYDYGVGCQGAAGKADLWGGGCVTVGGDIC